MQSTVFCMRIVRKSKHQLFLANIFKTFVVDNNHNNNNDNNNNNNNNNNNKNTPRPGNTGLMSSGG